MLGAELSGSDKRILLGADVVITVRPIVDTAAPIETSLRGQRGPAHVVLARAPGDPRWSPFVAGHPDPADAFQAEPAPVMVGGPAERLIGHPGPSGVAVNPAPFGVGPPVAGLFRFTRLPDVAIIIRFPPFAVLVELLVKHSIGRGRPFLCPGFGWLTLDQFRGHFGNSRRLL